MRVFKRAVVTIGLGLVGLAGCAAQEQRNPVVVTQVWGSPPIPFGETDSLAACRGEAGRILLFASAKEADRLDIYDAISGNYRGSIGRTGVYPRHFRYPNGLVGFELDDRPVLAVIERDNARIQFIDPQTLRAISAGGVDELTKPYGGAISVQAGRTLLYVTDVTEEPGQRVKVYELSWSDEIITARHWKTFGATSGPGVIQEPESIVVDDKFDRVFLCDELAGDVKVYNRAGEFVGTVLAGALLEADPEGIVIAPHAAGDLVILTDQRESATHWHTFDRASLDYVGTFIGQPTCRNTDGIAVYPEPFGRFMGGAFFAVNNDEDVRAYDLAAIVNSVRGRGAQAPE